MSEANAIGINQVGPGVAIGSECVNNATAEGRTRLLALAASGPDRRAPDMVARLGAREIRNQPVAAQVICAPVICQYSDVRYQMPGRRKRASGDALNMMSSGWRVADGEMRLTGFR